MTQEELRAYLDFMRTQPEDPLIPPPLMSLDENQRGTSWAPPGGWTRDYGPLTDAQKKEIAQAPSPPIPGTMSEWFWGVNPEPFRYEDLKDRLSIKSPEHKTDLPYKTFGQWFLGNYPQQKEEVTTPIVSSYNKKRGQEITNRLATRHLSDPEMIDQAIRRANVRAEERRSIEQAIRGANARVEDRRSTEQAERLMPWPESIEQAIRGANARVEERRSIEQAERLKPWPESIEQAIRGANARVERRSNEEFGALQGFGPGRGRGDVFSGGGSPQGSQLAADAPPQILTGTPAQADVNTDNLMRAQQNVGGYITVAGTSPLGVGAYPGLMSNGIPTSPEMSPTTGWEQYADPTRLGGPHDVSPAGINTLLDSPRFDIPASPEADSLVVSTAKSLVGDITGLMRDVTNEARGINLRGPLSDVTKGARGINLRGPGISNFGVNVANTRRGSWDANVRVSSDPTFGLTFSANPPFASRVAETVFGAPVAVASAIGGALTSFFSGLGDKRSEGVTDLGYSDTPPSDFALTDSSQPRGSDLGYSGENQGGEGNGTVGGTDDGTSGYDETDYDYDDEGDRW